MREEHQHVTTYTNNYIRRSIHSYMRRERESERADRLECENVYISMYVYMYVVMYPCI